MSASRADAVSARQLTNGNKGSPRKRKRKQEPDNDLASPSTPLKTSKRVKRDALSPLKWSPELGNRPSSKNEKKTRKNLTSDSQSESQEKQALVATKKTGKAKSKTDTNGQIDLDEAAPSATVKNASRAKARLEVVEFTATEVRDTSATPPKRKVKSRKDFIETIEDNESTLVEQEAASKKTPRRRKTKGETEAETPIREAKEEGGSPSRKKTKSTGKATGSVEEDEQVAPDVPKKIRRKRKTKEEKEAEAMPLAARTVGSRMFVGAHVSIATGVEKAVTNCVHIGGNAFALFLQSQRKWDNKPLVEENRLAFISMCEEHKYNASDHVLPHGSYLVNLAHEGKDRAKQAYDHFLDDLKRCEALGIKMYNFHPGASGKAPLSDAINRISSQLNRALAETETATPVLENMCGSGSVIGSRFSDLRDIIAGIKPEYKSRIGVCIDTCHAFAAGYDLRTPAAFQKTMQEFDDVVGMKYLKGLHINDSKAPFGSHRDLHQNIGLGFLGLRAFHNVMNEPRFQSLPLILETPCDRIDPSDPTGKKMIDDKSVWAREIKLLESLIGMDPEGDEFKKLEQELSEKGKASREKMQKAMDEKNKRAKKKLEKGQRSLLDMMGKESTDSSVLSELSEEEELDR